MNREEEPLRNIAANFDEASKPSRRAILGWGAAGVAAMSGAMLPAGLALGEAYERLPIGMNLAGIADWEPGYPFLNLMWGARPWLTRNAAGQGPWTTNLAAGIPLDRDGYPLELPVQPRGASEPQIVFTILPNVLRGGRYVLLYDGEGTFGFGGGTRVSEARSGRIEITMRHTANDLVEEISIRTSTKGNHIRNIRIVPLAHEKTDLSQNPFRPELIEFCRPWHCLRFMDWLSTNNSTSQSWTDRKTTSFYTQVGMPGDIIGVDGPPADPYTKNWSGGVAIELCLQLANITKTDAWICVPHLADDDYIRQMAKLVKERLDPSLKVYVEYSNELWNWMFGQARWMLRSELAGDLVIKGGGRSPWRGGARPTRFANGIVAAGAGEGVDHPERIGALFRRCFAIWENEFSGADRRRLVRVCGVQSSWFDTASRTLDWVMRNGGCDALAPAGYFGPDERIYKKWDQAGASLTVDQVIDDMRSMIKVTAKETAALGALAKRAGVRLISYEGGQHIQPEHQLPKPYSPALNAVQKHPAMYELLRANMNYYAQAGCDLFCAFNSIGAQGSRYGSWGHAEFYGQKPEDMPKYRAILDASTPRV